MVQFSLRFLINVGIVNFPFLDVEVPQRTSFGVYTSQLMLFARMSSQVTSFVVTKPLPLSSLNRAIVIINFVMRFQSFITYAVG